MDRNRDRETSQILFVDGCRAGPASEGSRKLESLVHGDQTSGANNVGGGVMLWVWRLWMRLQTLVRRPQVARQLDDEIQFHLEQQITENVAAGMSREEARHAALRTF